ncbi:probable pyridoxal 5'-phosphate synthase subunit PDX2 isoform X1 [Miscanthus floridulus]|uniref:probable pyridoxal 5'-phosphate synthase subunit PDX2 isoform X1 n=1 Tax=Miscanthus floridulus TaxID=154761 RepID=UPI00345AE93C
MAVVGVLALQGSYNEHMAALRRIGVKGVEVRKPEQLLGVDSLIIPGGESTTMAKLANYHNLFPALREFVGCGKPVWGTCAGLIFLANKAVALLAGQKTGGQELVGGLDCTVHRNFFGSQLQSFETELSVPKLSEKEGGNDTCRGVFIRAPAILEVGPDVEILADCPVPADRPSITISFGEGTEEEVYSKDRVIVAVRQGNILATAFHPELTSDSRWHRFFLDMDKESQAKAFSALSLSSSSRDTEDWPKNKPLDLPIFE